MELELQPTLHDDLVVLRPMLLSDFDNLFAAASDPLIWEQHPAKTRYTEPVFRDFFAAAVESRGALVVMDQATQRVIGTSRYAGYSPAASVVEIGWTFLARAYWGGKYNAAVKALMLRHAFGAVQSVVFKVGQHNIRSQRAVLKLGAKIEGEVSAGGFPSLCFRLSRDAYFSRVSAPATDQNNV
ncbi:MAG: GNAT family N-acetyltransferase [Deltaproteobacteria bacterium]|nr:GNAT family N-acetyltransferase [Deltaproteobacteria bacterium]